jgi:hypothetical protein
VYYPYPVYYPTDAAIQWQHQNISAIEYSECLQYSDQMYYEPGLTSGNSSEDYEQVQQVLSLEQSFGNTCTASESDVKLEQVANKVDTPSETDIDTTSDLSADEKAPVFLPSPSSLFAPHLPATTRDQEDFCNMKEMEESLERLLGTESEVVGEESEVVEDVSDDDDEADGILSLYASSGIHVKFK